MANSNFIFNLAFNVTGDESVEKVQRTLGDLVTAQQRVTATSAKQGQSQRKLTEENRKLAKQTQDVVTSLNRQRGQLEKGTAAYRANNVATATAQRSLKALNDTNDRYNSTVVGNQRREQRRREALIASSGATQKLEQETKSFISSLGQSTSMTERNVNEASQLISKIDEQVASNQKLQRSVGLTRKQQASLLKEEQRLIKTKESLQNRVSGTANRFEQFKRSAAAARADLQRLSADNLRAGETTESHKEEQQRLEQVLQDLGIEFKMLAEAGELSEQQMTQMSSALAGVKGQALQTDRNLRGMSQAFTGQTKATNSANQILLSFGDIAQDSAQFQFGFAQGMRAIGNNVTFVAEQFTIFAAKTAAANGGVLTMSAAMGTMKAALMGPAGLVVMLSAAVTVVTVLTGAMSRNKKEAEDMAESNSRLNEVIKTQISRLQDAKQEMDEMFSKESIQGRTEALTIERDRNNQVLSFLENEQKLLADKADWRKMLGSMDEEQIDAMNELEAMGFRDRKLDSERTKQKRKNLLSLVSADMGARIVAQQKLDIVNEEIDALKERNKEIDEGFFRLNLEERALGEINQVKQEGADKDVDNANKIAEATEEIRKRERKAQREINLLNAENTNDELERIEEVRRVREENLKQRAIDEDLTSREVALAQFQIDLDYNKQLESLRNERLQREMERQEELIKIQERTAQARLNIETSLADSTRAVNQQMISSIQGSLSTMLGSTKASAIAMLALEKGLAIGRLMADATAKAASLKAEGTKLMFEGGAKMLSPLTIAQGVMEIKQASAMISGAGAIMAAAKKDASKIAAIGLGQIIGIAATSTSGAGGGTGGGRGGARSTTSSTEPSIQAGFSEADQTLPNYMPGRGASRNGGVKQIVEFNLDETGFSFFTNRSTSVLGARTVNLESSDA